ncbi:MAG: cation-translocating P-type ATPase [Acidobacteria bacterium]|nr:cation-translocating P-type ATPase [Acidobacteriota bacterium]
MKNAHIKKLDEICKELNCSAAGLSSKEAARRQLLYGPNRLEKQKAISPWLLLLEQFKNVLIIILLIATSISMVLGHGVEAIAIAVIVLFAVLLGFIQEYRAEKAIEALKQMAAPTARVIRDGKEQVIAAIEIVPGDIFLLSAGDRIPADARLIQSVNLKAEESSLTGESLPAEKDHDYSPVPDAVVGDRKNMVYAGTSISYGRGRAVAMATGMNTELGKIARMLQQVETEKTPLQKSLNRVGATLARAAILIVLMIIALGLFRGQAFIEMLIFGIALAVAVVPEALPAVVTISLALGVKRLVRRNALMRRLSAVETLGSTTVVCSDKTGTLTRDEMTVKSILLANTTFEVSGSGYSPEGTFTSTPAGANVTDTLRLLLTAGVLCNDARFDQDEAGAWMIAGDPTEGALLVAARKAGINESQESSRLPRIYEQPFTSETKRMITIHVSGGESVAFIKGAPEVLIPDCSYQQTDEGITPLDLAGQQLLLEKAKEMAAQALRIIAIATKPGATLSDANSGLTFLGLVGIIDPPRPEAKEAVRTCIEAGIRPVMITGDHPITAQAIARELGILTDGRVVIGSELQNMTESELDSMIGSIQVFARVAPEHKLRIVEAFQRNGHIVAMTGDGVNDAPALKKADIGIAMGITGTDVSKEAAAMILTDDNFASIVTAVEEGRGIYDNIKKFLTYLLAANIGEITLMIGATVMGMPLPLSAVQILYINLATDGLPALALAVDPTDKAIMQRKPKDPKTGIFTKPLLTLMLASGFWSAIVNLSLFHWARMSGKPLAEAMTMIFVSLILIEFLKAYSFRSERETIIRQPFANKWLNLAIGWEIILMVFVVYFPFLQKPFGSYSLPLQDWLIIVTTAVTIIPVIELTKWIIRREWFGLKNA